MCLRHGKNTCCIVAADQLILIDVTATERRGRNITITPGPGGLVPSSECSFSIENIL